MRNLIICPVGNPLTFDSRFDKENHWRYTKDHRLYETLVYQYSDFVPEDGTYDQLIKQKGFKWNLAKEWINNNDYSQYEYIGFMDDDLITDIDNINTSLSLAKDKNLKIFQMSLTDDSDVFYPILRNTEYISYTKTNFVEVMGPFIHTSLLPIIQKFWNMYGIFSGWGFDKVLCDITDTEAAVVHKAMMYHPKKESSYDKSKAFQEMHLVTNVLTPLFMRTHYNKEWSFTDQQIITSFYTEV